MSILVYKTGFLNLKDGFRIFTNLSTKVSTNSALKQLLENVNVEYPKVDEF